MAYASNVYQAKDITIYYDCTGLAGTAWVYTDMKATRPGAGVNPDQVGGLGEGLNDHSAEPPIATGNLPITVGRGSVTITLDEIGVDGVYTEGTMYMLEVRAGAGGIIRLFEASIRVRKIGVYLQPGQTFRSNPLSFGAGQSSGG